MILHECSCFIEFNEMRISDTMEICQAFYLFSTSLINLIIQEHELPFDIKINLKSNFWCKKIKICNYVRNVVFGRHFITLSKSVKH